MLKFREKLVNMKQISQIILSWEFIIVAMRKKINGCMVRFFRKKKNFICLIVQEKLYDLPKKQW